GVAYVGAKKAATVAAAHIADSVSAHVKDSTDKVEKAKLAVDAAAAVDAVPAGPLTPADSIRALQNVPTTLSEATRGLPNAVDLKHGEPQHSESTLPKTDPSQPVGVGRGDSKKMAEAKSKPAATQAATVAEPVHAVPAAIEGPLPEKRIAKIFGAMQSKDAARVLEQMNDSDVRIILSMMPDKQAAAILTTFPPARAAIISRAETTNKKPNGVTP
ncbi:MAG: hypothetical protein M3Y64_11905, partial [Gemmatimonadota bacterium]|nr:hypothetical protein [Gemmatimonadota bacterium]